MPKALLSIPPLQISNGNSSETETGTEYSAETTDRSTASQSVSSASQHEHKSRRFSYGQGKAKARKIAGKRNQKKLSLNVKQNTGIILAYRQRAAYRRNAQIVSNALLQTKNSRQDQMEFCNKIYHYNEMGYAGGAQQDPRMAGMKAIAIIVLNVWRKRRNDVRCLREEKVELKNGAIKSRNQFHVLNSLYHGEQKRNDEIKSHLKRSLDDINTIKSTCESLTTSIISVKADNALLEQQLQTKDKEFESLNILLSQTTAELFKSMTMQRELQANNSECHRKVQTLENQINDLINEMLELDIETRKTQELMKAEIQEKTDELGVTQAKLRGMEDKVAELHDCKKKETLDTLDKQQNMRKQVEKLEEEIIILQRTLEKSLERRIKTFCNNALKHPAFVFALHCFAFYLLPAPLAPKPTTFPFRFTFGIL